MIELLEHLCLCCLSCSMLRLSAVILRPVQRRRTVSCKTLLADKNNAVSLAMKGGQQFTATSFISCFVTTPMLVIVTTITNSSR